MDFMQLGEGIKVGGGNGIGNEVGIEYDKRREGVENICTNNCLKQLLQKLSNIFKKLSNARFFCLKKTTKILLTKILITR